MENMTKLLTELTIDENEIPKKTVRKEKAVTSKKSNLEIAISQFNEWVIAGYRKIGRIIFKISLLRGNNTNNIPTFSDV